MECVALVILVSVSLPEMSMTSQEKSGNIFPEAKGRWWCQSNHQHESHYQRSENRGLFATKDQLSAVLEDLTFRFPNDDDGHQNHLKSAFCTEAGYLVMLRYHQQWRYCEVSRVNIYADTCRLISPRTRQLPKAY